MRGYKYIYIFLELDLQNETIYIYIFVELDLRNERIYISRIGSTE